MIGRSFVKQLAAQRQLLRSRPNNILSKRNRWDDINDVFVYRRIGEYETWPDWTATLILSASFVFAYFTNLYMNWDELRPYDDHRYNMDVHRFTNQELGIPGDDLGYAPLKPEIIESGKIKDLGNATRTERTRYPYYIMAREGKIGIYDF